MNFPAVFMRGQLAHPSGKLADAARDSRRCLQINPDQAQVLYAMGTLFLQMDQPEIGVQFLNRAHDLARANSNDLDDGQKHSLLHNLGGCYKELEFNDAAMVCYRKALEMKPDDVESLAMMAGLHVNNGTPEQAVEWADKALAIDPDNPHALNHKALATLEQGRWDEGFALYARRFEIPSFASISRREFFDVPQWDGKSPGRVYLHGEQGLGDELLFLSVLAQARLPNGLGLTIECAPRLHALIGNANLPCVERIVGSHEETLKLGRPDFWLPLGDLPRVLDWSKPVDWLRPEGRGEMMVNERMPDGWLVGIAWRGGTRKTHSRLRSPGPDVWRAFIADVRKAGYTPISVQYGDDAPAEAEALGIPHWHDMNSDLDLQAGLISSCRLIVSVCQTAVHLAGAMGQDVWCVTPKAKAWRYATSPDDPPGMMRWYSGVRLFEQTDHGKWGPVFSKMSREIEAMGRRSRVEAA